MANKLIKRRPNNLLTGRNHYFKFGDFLFNKDESGQVTNRGFGNMSSLGQGLLGAAGTAVGQLGGGLIGGGLQSGAGNIIQGLSGIASSIPGPWGTVASAGLGLVGGVVNKLWGSKMNKENIAKVESNINDLNTFTSNAADYDSLGQNWSNAVTGMTFSNDYIGKDGIFSHKARNKANALREQVGEGIKRVDNVLSSNARNIANSQTQNLLANYTAYGGPLFAEGGRIHIKPENRGKFTETKRRTGKTTEELTHSKNPLTRKRAIFAQNAKKWHHAFGGDLMTHGANFDTGLILVGNGGTHEENPNEGVPMGMDSEGIPNLVEEGEAIFNDYVFSNRLKVPKTVRNKYKLRGTKPLTFADAAIQMSKESEERPNDPISQAGLDDSMIKLMIAQEDIRAKKDTGKYSKGGRLNKFADGGTPDWIKNLGTEYITDEVNLNGTPYSFRSEIPSDTMDDLYNLVGSDLDKPNPVKTEARTKNYGSVPTWMRYTPAIASGIMSITDALGWTNKPDFSEANAVLDAARGAGTYSPVKFNPIGNYMTYRPFDRDYYTNKLNAEASAARRAVLNTAGGNRAQAMAGILASDYNTQGRMGDMFRQAEEYNLAQRQKVEDFNRATNMYNSEGFMKADTANQAALMQQKSSYLKGALAASELRQKERQMSTASRSANLSNFINSLGDIGRENFSRNMIVNDPSKYYRIDNSGNIFYKNGYDSLDEATQAYITGVATKDKAKRNSNKNSRGGYLTIRRK